ncbi:2OG-Fe-II oxygenase family oxidoreductase [Dendrothele bispora CBS 962.96]|uniref:2OG-Fe-II oxygenase family oxidoreductase n=1 Tax=Dendrothele bispora (strain CBS 962.96) TaxID=1314807 RepID=A0A4V6T5B4_DENBC|nr:2OG-Fe-II oxygenase family oxidoreductase [Dendrothele bispora CBS 962.96]
MAIQTNNAWPAFPGDEQVEIASLDTVDFGRLLIRDPAEIKKLLDVCMTHGFFYLDLQTCKEGLQIIDDEQSVYRFMEEYFAKSLEIKMLDDRKSFLHGFKPIGVFTGTKESHKDAYETLKVKFTIETWNLPEIHSNMRQVAREEMDAKSELLPDSVKAKIELFDRFMGLSNLVNSTLLMCLSDALGLTGSARLEESHRRDQKSNTCLVMLHYPPTDADSANIGHNKHTDIGSITLLFSEQWGLQVFDPETQAWKFIQPRPHGHATINVGDSLRFLSEKKLYSCLHRVIPPTSDVQTEDRYSIAYFLRPENAAVLEDADGKSVAASKWHDDKYVMFGAPHEEQDKATILTGGMETILGRA